MSETCAGCVELRRRLDMCHSDITKRRILSAGHSIIKRYEGRPDIQRELASMVMTLADVPPGDADELDVIAAGSAGSEC